MTQFLEYHIYKNIRLSQSRIVVDRPVAGQLRLAIAEECLGLILLANRCQSEPLPVRTIASPNGEQS
jgi:hypothetical protein